MKKHLYPILILFLFVSLDGISQSSKVNGITSQYKKLDSVNLQGDSLYDLAVTVHLIDTLNVSKILIQIGHGFNGADVLNGEYNWYDSTLSTPNSVEYDREFYMVHFKIKNVVPSVLFYKANTYDFQSVAGLPFIRQQ